MFKNNLILFMVGSNLHVNGYNMRRSNNVVSKQYVFSTFYKADNVRYKFNL